MNYFVILFLVLTIMAALGVVLSKNALHSALCLVLTFLLLAVHYAFLDAHFLAALQVMVYAGAIMVLVIFVIMLMGLASAPSSNSRLSKSAWIVSALCSGLFFVALFTGVLTSVLNPSITAPDQLPTIASDFGTTAKIGKLLFTRYVYPFELLSLLLLAAIIGSVLLAHEPKRKLPPGRGLKAMREGGE